MTSMATGAYRSTLERNVSPVGVFTMLGWWITIKRASDSSGRKIASWEASIGGTDWLDGLVQQGRATQLQWNGYPNRYEAKAGDVINLIANGPPPHAGPLVVGDDYISEGGWSKDFILDADLVAGCAPDDVLIVEAWDQS